MEPADEQGDNGLVKEGIDLWLVQNWKTTATIHAASTSTRPGSSHKLIMPRPLC